MKRLALSLLAAALAVSLAACGRPARNTDDLEALLEELEDYAPSSEADTSQQEGPDLSQITPPTEEQIRALLDENPKETYTLLGLGAIDPRYFGDLSPLVLDVPYTVGEPVLSVEDGDVIATVPIGMDGLWDGWFTTLGSVSAQLTHLSNDSWKLTGMSFNDDFTMNCSLSNSTYVSEVYDKTTADGTNLQLQYTLTLGDFDWTSCTFSDASFTTTDLLSGSSSQTEMDFVPFVSGSNPHLTVADPFVDYDFYMTDSTDDGNTLVAETRGYVFTRQ